MLVVLFVLVPKLSSNIVILGLSITGSITQVTKLTVGRPRPGACMSGHCCFLDSGRTDIIDRCQPIPGSVDPIYGLSNSSICTTPNNSAIMLDGFRSFPSGHAVPVFIVQFHSHSLTDFAQSLSAAGLGFLAFYLAGKLHLFDHRGYAVCRHMKNSPIGRLNKANRPRRGFLLCHSQARPWSQYHGPWITAVTAFFF
jgi:diacylglycerol diphosphate phosphatase/phosphatidate phosphatase